MPPIPPLRIPAFEDIPSARPPPRSPVPSAPAIKKPVLSLALDEEIRPRPTFTPAFVVGMIVTLLVAGGVVALAMKQRATSRTAEREAEIDHVRLPLLRDTGESYREVAAELGDAHALTPDDAVIVSAISTCHARWAQMLLDEAAFEPDSGRAATLRSLAAEHAQEAMRFATHALSLAPSVSFARFAQADAVRLAGDLDRAESLLRSASSASTDTVESSRILAALAADRSPVSEETRLASERALALARNDAQRLVLVARAAIARRDLTALDDALGRLGSASPTHRGIAYLARARETLVFDAGGVP